MKKRSFLKMAGLSVLGWTALGREEASAKKTTVATAAPAEEKAISKVVARNEEAVNNILASKKYLDMKTMGWGTKSKTNLFTLAHLSDIHTDSKRYKNFQEFVDGVDFINAAICTGDFVIAAKKEEFEFMKHVSFKKPFIKVVGNHERARTEDATLPFVYKHMGMNTNTGKLYYYQDFEEFKIRIIILNQFDIDIKSSINSAVEHYSQEQIDWFIEVLKDAQRKNYAVAIAMHSSNLDLLPVENQKGFYQRHYSWLGESGSVISGPIIEDIVAAFRSGGSINKTYTYKDVPMKTVANTSFEQKGIFMAYMVGHMHGDFIGYSKYHQDQLYLMMNVSCCMPEFANYNYGEEVSDLPRVENTQCEDCFNVYSFDVENQMVKVVRVGAGVNDLMEDRKKAYYPFDGLH